jgi:putative transposase
VERHRGERDEQGHALVVRNGQAKPRKLTLGAGTVELKAPRVDDRRRDENGERQRFTSQILPPYMRRSPKVAEVLPILYLRGLSTGDFRPALESLLGKEAAGLSPTNIARLTACWEKEYVAFRRRDLAGREYVYVWVDGVHFNIRLEDDRLCTLVMIGALPNGEKELLAVEDGYRESAESWKALLRELKRRGMTAPVVAVGDGALGFWAAAREVWPETREQGCWCHKLSNVLDKLPKRLQPRAKRALREMIYAEQRADCEAARVRFEAEYQAKYPKAVEAPAHHQPDRIAIRHRAAARTCDARSRFKNQGPADGLQAARHDPATLAPPRWPSSIASGPSRRELRRWSAPGS